MIQIFFFSCCLKIFQNHLQFLPTKKSNFLTDYSPDFRIILPLNTEFCLFYYLFYDKTYFLYITGILDINYSGLRST